VFLVSGAGSLTITYALVDHATGPTSPPSVSLNSLFPAWSGRPR
jgi:hypothetical protein